MNARTLLSLLLLLPAQWGWTDVDFDGQDVGSERLEQPAKKTPISISGHVDCLAPSKISSGFFKHDNVHFAEAHGEAGMIVYYCPAYTEGARVALGYTATRLDWSENPWFDQNYFHTVNLTLAGFSKRLDRWFWRSQLTVNFDTAEWSAPYTSYDILLWGRYAYCQDIGVHLGFFAQTGLRLDRVYPVIGADWQISRCWKLNLVYPVNVSLDYALTPYWSLAAGARFFNSRFRIKHHEVCSKALVRYTNTGIELAVKYNAPHVTANLHAGVAVGGKYRVANQNNRHAHNYKLDPTSYVGGEVEVSF